MMAEKSKAEKQLEWACRILMTLDVIVILAGYLSFFQAKWQLTSPLIPKDLVYRIMDDGADRIMNASIIAGVIFMTGIWFYSFQKRRIAAGLFGMAVIAFSIFRL